MQQSSWQMHGCCKACMHAFSMVGACAQPSSPHRRLFIVSAAAAAFLTALHVSFSGIVSILLRSGLVNCKARQVGQGPNRANSNDMLLCERCHTSYNASKNHTHTTI